MHHAFIFCWPKNRSFFILYAHVFFVGQNTQDAQKKKYAPIEKISWNKLEFSL
jgi:hypothetical protein